MSLYWKRHYPIALMLVAILAGLAIFFGKVRVIAYTTDQGSKTSELSGCTDNSIDLMDESIVHSVSVSISDDDLTTMLTTYQETGEKDYFHADVTLDGVTLENVGIRLKGNASLRTAAGKGNGGGGMPGGGGGGMPGNNRPNRQNQQMLNGQDDHNPQNQGQNFGPGQNQAPNGVEEQNPIPDGMGGPGQNTNQPQGQMGAQNPMANPGEGGAMPQMGQPGAMPGQNAQPAEPGQDQTTTLQPQTVETTTKNLTTMNVPYKIKFDEFEEDQCYQGLSEINIRTAGTATDAAMLQEPLTYAMARLAGIPAPQTVYTGFKMNDSAEKLLVISELVNEEYLEKNFSNPNGILYKAEMGSSLDYKGDDPSSYSKSFSQETRKNEADLAPLIEFTRFLTDSSDADFDAQLPSWLDVDSFAAYLAVNNLLVNRDSMADMNNNYYLYYDNEAEKFSVLLWDANESLGKLGGGNQNANYDLYYTRDSQNTRGPGGGGKNILVQRFFASAKYTALYEEKYTDAYRKIFLSGAVNDAVDQYASLVDSELQTRALVDQVKYEEAVEKDRAFLASRLAYLKSTDLLAGIQ